MLKIVFIFTAGETGFELPGDSHTKIDCRNSLVLEYLSSGFLVSAEKSNTTRDIKTLAFSNAFCSLVAFFRLLRVCFDVIYTVLKIVFIFTLGETGFELRVDSGCV